MEVSKRLKVESSTKLVTVLALEKGQSTRYLIGIQGFGEIHTMIVEKPQSYNDMLKYYVTARPALKEKLVEIGNSDPETICQELQVSITTQASLEKSGN